MMIDLAQIALRLPSRFEVMAFTATERGDAVVLCRLPDNAATPYATWRVAPTGDCAWGHYEPELGAAMVDYADRVKRLVDRL